MSLLLLFSDQVAAAASGDVVTSMLVETTEGVWYDATSDLISGTVVRGKQHLLDQYQAGTADVLLDNDDRKYDPTYAASPLNGHIAPMKRVQLRDTYAGITYPLFAGYADRWVQNRVGPHRGTTSLAATDGFKVLERAFLPASVFALEAAADTPVAWFRLGEPAGSGVVHDRVSLRTAAAVGTPTLGGDGMVTNDADGSVTVDDGDGFATDWAPTTLISSLPLTLSAIVRTTSGVNSLIAKVVDASDRFILALLYNGNVARVMAMERPLGFSEVDYNGSIVIDDGSPHVITATISAGGLVTLYTDGVANGTPVTATDPFTTVTDVVIGKGPNTGTSLTGDIDEVFVFNTDVPSVRIAAWSSARATPWDGDLPGARIERVLDAVNWDALARDIDTGSTTLQSAELDMRALEHVQKVAETEFGNFYMTAGGVARFEDRNASVDQPVLFTFSDAPGGDLPITFSDPEISDDQIRNDVTVSRLDGTAQNVKDATSIASYLTSSYARDGLYHDDDAHSRYMAQYILEAYKTPVERVSQMTVNPYRDPTALWPAVLAVELTDRVVLNETPQNVSPEVSRTLVVEGITHTFAAKQWQATFALSESTAQTQAYWQLGVAGFSELGETTRLFF